jgi:hypothetical protein
VSIGIDRIITSRNWPAVRMELRGRWSCKCIEANIWRLLPVSMVEKRCETVLATIASSLVNSPKKKLNVSLSSFRKSYSRILTHLEPLYPYPSTRWINDDVLSKLLARLHQSSETMGIVLAESLAPFVRRQTISRRELQNCWQQKAEDSRLNIAPSSNTFRAQFA